MDAAKDRRLNELLDAFLGDEVSAGKAVPGTDAFPVQDYLAQLEQMTPDLPETPADRTIRSTTESLLDAFLSKAADPGCRLFDLKPDIPVDDESDEAESDEVTTAESLDESYFTESLARIYLKQHRYEKALEIIRSLYLNFPNKSIYFADQIRYLELLVRINQKN